MERVHALHDEAKLLRDLADMFDNPILRNSLRTMANDCDSFAKTLRHELNAIEAADAKQSA